VNNPRIRPIAIGLFRQAQKILVIEYFDHVKQETFYRPLGGGIEFGETAQHALQREISEELGAEAVDLEYRFTLESIFTCNGKPGHEIVLVFEGRLADPEMYRQEEINGHEDDGSTLRVVWKAIEDFGPGKCILYPEGLLERI